jgi:hypothetical protein
MSLGNGAVLAVPIPAEHAAEGQAIEAAVKQALREADEKGVAGNQVSNASNSCFQSTSSMLTKYSWCRNDYSSNITAKVLSLCRLPHSCWNAFGS